MLKAELQDYLYEHIPLSKAMEVTVISVDDDSVVLQAPLGPNINHRETVFGGSASSLAILAAWSFLHTRLGARVSGCHLVIQRNTMEYMQPIPGDFTARSALNDPSEWRRFSRMLERRGKARITVSSMLEYAGDVVGKFSGEFVVVS